MLMFVCACAGFCSSEAIRYQYKCLVKKIACNLIDANHKTVIRSAAMSYQALQKALKACGNNQTELARRMGVDRQLVSQWIKNKRVPEWRVQKLLEITGPK